MVLPQEPAILSPEQVLTAYATIRGFMATGGRPDQVSTSLINAVEQWLFLCGILPVLDPALASSINIMLILQNKVFLIL
jgi:hypothetical protein